MAGDYRKVGLDYFSVTCQFNDQVKLIQAEFGLKGLGILIRLWQKIYGEKGYYVVWNDEVALMFADECRVGVSVVVELVNACLKRGVFDRQKYDQYQILTSEGIQTQYARGTTRRLSQKIDGRYLLISAPKNWVMYNNPVANVDISAENADISQQSKVIVKEESYNDNTTTTYARTREEAPYGFEIAEYFESRGVKKAGEQALRFAKYNEERGWDCLPNWQDAADRWILRL